MITHVDTHLYYGGIPCCIPLADPDQLIVISGKSVVELIIYADYLLRLEATEWTYEDNGPKYRCCRECIAFLKLARSLKGSGLYGRKNDD